MRQAALDHLKLKIGSKLDEIKVEEVSGRVLKICSQVKVQLGTKSTQVHVKNYNLKNQSSKKNSV